MDEFSAAMADICGGWAALRPPNRLPVSRGAAQSLRIARPGGSTGMWNPAETPYMVEPMDMLASRRHSAVVFVAPAQTGKALDIDTPIPTPSGWRRMGDLQFGDVAFDERGEPTWVVFATEHQHDRECFEIAFSDGSRIVADADHLWAVERHYWAKPTWRPLVLTTRQMVDDFRLDEKRFRYRIPTARPLQLPHADLLIDPYLLGVWLGDGASRQATISSHIDDVGHYQEAFRRCGHTAEWVVDKGNTVALCIDIRGKLTTHCQRGHSFADEGRTRAGYCRRCAKDTHWRKKYGIGTWGEDLSLPPMMFAESFSSRLHRLGVHRNKHIPAVYLRASEDQRWALLRGLMDTDGTCSQEAASAEFTTAQVPLLNGFMELARSLGLKPTARPKLTRWAYKGERRGGAAYRITFPIPPGVQLFSLPRKVSRQRTATIEVEHRMIVGIKPVPTRPVKCIQVSSPSHLYLAGEAMVPTHNTAALVDGWLTHAVVNDPGDMLIIQMTQEKAREYSKQRIDRAIRHSPDLYALRGPSSRDDNLHDKQFKHGMWLRIAWPTVTNLSSTSYRYVAITDYDRIPDDIDGEGDAFTLGRKRTTTFLSRGKIAVESSPGRPVKDPHWRPATPHEAPPVGGILGIYNRGDRRRWYWTCRHCQWAFEAAPGLGLFRLPPDDQLLTDIRRIDLGAMARQYARVPCPKCGAVHGPDLKESLNRHGCWMRDDGDKRVSDIASYWLGGVAAAYVSWETLILKHLQALLDYAMTGQELALQTTVNTDQGAPYMARALTEAAEAGASSERRDATLQKYVAPAWARFLIATVDVQGGSRARFDVQVHAIGPMLEWTVIDRFHITSSTRQGPGGAAPLDPAGYPEDWDLLTDKVLRSTYRIEGSDLEVRPHLVVVDTGGEQRARARGQMVKVHEGVTANAYAWWRRLRVEGGAHRRVMLIKGQGGRMDWSIKKTMVGAKAGLGDVPLYLLNTNLLKDVVAASARRLDGPGALRFPAWLPESWWDEFGAEVRNEDGTWTQIRARNEAFDHCQYTVAGWVMLGVEKWTPERWLASPAWAAPLAHGNANVMTRDERRDMRENERVATAPVVVAPQPELQRPQAAFGRRSVRSSYLS